MGKARETVVFSIRVDKRIADKLDILAKKNHRKRNNLIELVLAEKTGILSEIMMEDEND